MKVTTIKAANKSSQDAGHLVRRTVISGATELVDGAWLVGSSVFKFGKGLFSDPAPIKLNARVAESSY